MRELWYRQPAKIWEEALPLGNGRIGAMVFGNIENERIQVNEESIWYGGKKDRINPDALEYLPEVRRLIAEGHISAAQELMATTMTGCPASQNPYQILGDLKLYFKHHGVAKPGADSPDVAPPSLEPSETSYRRSLSLSDAICRTEYEVAGVKYVRECFISKPADCMVLRLTASVPGKICVTVKQERGHYFKGVGKTYARIAEQTTGSAAGATTAADGMSAARKANGIMLYGRPGEDGNAFVMMTKCKASGGTLKVLGENLIVEDADEAILYFGVATQYIHANATYEELQALLCDQLEQVMQQDYQDLRTAHVADYKALFDRVELNLDTSVTNPLPTDERLARVQAGEVDLGLEELIFDYGRYLMIAGSRPGGLPLTLQGLWNKDFTPPWESKYTININLEMNYWPAETCNLSECHLPLVELIKKMRTDGRKVAREMYGCRGFVAHHNTDMHGDCAPQDLWIPSSYWPMGVAWLCTHLWTHYVYTKDLAFLKEAFPLMAEAALYFVDALQPWGDYFVTNPSCSPENVYLLPNGDRGCVCMGPT
ncbi:MAG: glycoside hydrolase family 95 protein, partial [Lachnospiraceae bacterium]|nr:glycoside hydrolase family 95 protein [Lachnospiraceae bacterium]